MEKQFNTDLSPTELTPISTYSDGQPSTPETVNLNTVFVDETVEVLLAYSESEERLYIHIRLSDECKITKTLVKHFREILFAIEDELKHRGFVRYWTFAVDKVTFKFNKFFGFQSAYVVFNNEIELMYKDI